MPNPASFFGQGELISQSLTVFVDPATGAENVVTSSQPLPVTMPTNVDTAALINAVGATTTQTSADQTNPNSMGLIAVLNMATVGTGSVTLTIQGKDVASGQYYTLLTGLAVTTNSVNVYTVYPGAPVVANVSTGLPLPHIWRVSVNANNANATTYTVGASVIVG
jgi:hypothetical protein